MNQANVGLIEQWAGFQTSHNIEELIKFFDEGVVYEDVALGLIQHSQKEIAGMFKNIYAAMPDYAIKLVSVVADDNRGGAEFLMSGTLVNDYADWQATGQSFSLRAASAMRFSNGLVTHWNDYWSVETFKEQVGLK